MAGSDRFGRCGTSANDAAPHDARRGGRAGRSSSWGASSASGRDARGRGPQARDVAGGSNRADSSGRSDRPSRSRSASPALPGPEIPRRAFLAVFGSLSAAALFKLTDYQIVHRDRYLREANARRLTNQTLYARRGTIYDRNGNVLTKSIDCQNVYVNPKLITKPARAVKVLVDALGVDEETCDKLVRSNTTFAYIKRQVDQDVADKIKKKNVAGIEFEPTVKRTYPYGQLCSQVLGTVNMENKGATGLESYYEKLLAGTNGWIVRERANDAAGSFIAGGAYKKEAAIDGEDIVLSIDINIQRAAEEAIAQAVKDSGASTGSAIVVEPSTGEILAACSYPTFDPTHITTEGAKNMNLRVVTQAYEPGSVFKALVCGAGIELGVVSPDTTFTVPPSVMAGDDPVQDSDRRDYTMTMTLREILRRSSNTGMILVAKKIGADRFAEYVKRWQIGSSSGVDYSGENHGIVKERSAYDGATMASMSFGQALSVVPIEMTRALTALANDGVMTTPHFLRSRDGQDVDWAKKNRRIFTKGATDQVKSMMETVVTSGTGMGAQIAGYSQAGKTGTAERASTDGGYLKDSHMSSFVGFTTVEHPRAMAYVLLDGTPEISSVALPPYKTIMEATIKALGISADSDS